MTIQDISDCATELRATEKPTNLRAGMEPLQALTQKMSLLDETLEALSGLGDAGTEKSVARLRQKLAAFEPSITLLGQVKSGKTSLANAMAGWADLLPSDVNPWTSVVTSLHLVPKNQPIEKGATFQFMSEQEWDRLLVKGGRIGELADRAGADSDLQKIREQIEQMREKSRARLGRKFELLLGQTHEYGFFDKNLVERYICLGDDFGSADDAENQDISDDQGRFADITKSADLHLNSPTVPCRLCLRDTPGVNDTFMMREQVTIQAVRESRTCVVVLSAQQALTSVDMGLIRLISNLNSRDVIIFVNRIDELPDPSSQIPEIERSIQKTLSDHQGPTGAQVIFGSALWANAALAGELDNLSNASRKAMVSWARATRVGNPSQAFGPDAVWTLSGLPLLFAAMSTRIAADLGQQHITRIAHSATTLVGSLQAAEAVLIGASQSTSVMNMYDIQAELDVITKTHLEELDASFASLIADYHNRSDRVHNNFIQRATHSLIEHLERFGEDDVWEYSPAGLRMLLRSAYNVFGARAQAAAKLHNEAAVGDLAVLYSKAFGSAVEGIEIAVPSPPDVPSPVVLGQTIALDFRDGWWTSWWRRTRGYKAFAKRFNQLISAETEDFMTQLKTVQTTEIRDSAMATLAEFLAEQTEILSSLGSRAAHVGGDVQELFYGQNEAQRRKKLQSIMDTLSRCAAWQKTEE